MKKAVYWILDHPIAVSVVAFLLLLVLIGCLDSRLFNAGIDSDYIDVLVEAHGLLFDLLLFGIVLTLFGRFTEKRQKIGRYKEEIDDYRRWNEKEATFRIVGNIKRLNKLGVSDIDLSFCYLRDAKLPDVDLESANLFLAQLQRADLARARLNNANLQATRLQHANLENAKLRNANLQSARLQKALLCNADLQDADLRAARLQGALLSRIYMNSPYIVMDEQGDIVRPDGIKVQTVSASLKGANLKGATALEGQRDELVKAGADIKGIRFVTSLDEKEEEWEHQTSHETHRAASLWRSSNNSLEAPRTPRSAKRWLAAFLVGLVVGGFIVWSRVGSSARDR